MRVLQEAREIGPELLQLAKVDSLITSQHIFKCYPLAIMCFELTTPSNGQVVYSDLTSPYDFDTMVTYVCYTGFGLSGGDEILTCGGDGSSQIGEWSGVIPTCEGILCALANTYGSIM